MGAVSFKDELTDEHKHKFAAELIRKNGKAFDAALAVFGSESCNTGRVAYVASTWPNDAKVIELRNKLLEDNGAIGFLPTKESAQLRVWEWTQEGPIEDKIKAMKLLAEMSGWITRPDIGASLTQNFVSNVMEVTNHGTDSEWEAKMKAQQERLRADGAAELIRH